MSDMTQTQGPRLHQLGKSMTQN